MPYVLFDKFYPEIAERETRKITVFRGNQWGLPAGDYGFVEMFCDEPDCDCRRVFFSVVSSRGNKTKVEAVVTYGWSRANFYSKWWGDNDPKIIAELQGPGLNVGSPQSPLAPALLKLAKEVLLQDDAYVERIKRHYRLFREKLLGKGKEAQKKVKGFKRKIKGLKRLKKGSIWISGS